MISPVVSLLDVQFGEGACETRGLHPTAGGAIWLIKRRGGAFNKLDLPKQRVALLGRLLARWPRSLLRWKGTPPASGDLAEMKTRMPYTWAIPAAAPADKLHALVEAGEWLIYGDAKGEFVEHDRLDVWDERKGLMLLSSVPDFFVGARVGGDPWIFWMRPGIDWRVQEGS